MTPGPVKEQIHVLRAINNKSISDKLITKHLHQSKSFLDALVLLLRNTCQHKNIKLTSLEQQALCKNRPVIRVLVDPKQSNSDKRQVLTLPLIKLIAGVASKLNV